MQDVGFLLGRLGGFIIIGFLIEGVILLVWYIFKGMANLFRKKLSRKEPIKFKKTIGYYSLQALKYFSIGALVSTSTSAPYEEEHQALFIVLAIISGIAVCLLYLFSNKLEHKLKKKTIID